MYTDFKDSIKARLYDFKYTPFLASYTFFWLFFNAKMILIFFNSKLTVQDKIDMLAYDDINIITPLLYALAYTIVFPLFTAGFYFITLQYRRLMNKIQQMIEDVTPLPQKEANEIKKENANLRIELDENINELNKSKKKFETKEESLIKEFKTKELELITEYKEMKEQYDKDFDNKIFDATETLIAQKEALAKEIEEKDKLLIENEKTINGLQAMISHLKSNKNQKSPSFELGSTVKDIKLGSAVSNLDIALNNATKQNIDISDDEKLLLQVIYEDDISSSRESEYISKLAKANTFKKIKIKALLSSLVTKEIMELNSRNYYDVTDKGRNIMLSLFDK